MDAISIESVKNDEAELLQRVSRLTFFDTYSSFNTPENIRKYLNDNLSLEKITEELNNTNSKFYFAKKDGDILGYLKVSYNGMPPKINDKNALEIERIYVLKGIQGKGIGQQLIEKAVDVAKESNLQDIWLGVWEENRNAINFYTRNGFVAYDKHVFMLGNDEQIDVLMKRSI